MVSYTVNSEIFAGMFSRIRSFVKIIPSRNHCRTDVVKSWHGREFLTWQICPLALVANTIKILVKICEVTVESVSTCM